MARILALPLILLWYTLFQQTDLVALLKDVQNSWYDLLFPFVGLYFMFLCVPLQLGWMVKNFELKKLSLLNAIALVVQPAFLFFSLYNK